MSILDNARAEALFASTLQPSSHPDIKQVRAAVSITIRTLHVSGCACRVAAEFGDHPEVAAVRMAWAIVTIQAAYPPRCRRRNVLSATSTEPTSR